MEKVKIGVSIPITVELSKNNSWVEALELFSDTDKEEMVLDAIVRSLAFTNFIEQTNSGTPDFQISLMSDPSDSI